MARTATKFRSDEIATAVEAFVHESGRVVKRGGRLRGDDPLVLHAPHLFVRDGATDEEIGQARARMTSFLDEAPVVEPHIQLPGELKADNPAALIVERDASFRLEDGSMVVVRAGDLVDGREPWVAKAKRAKRASFRKPTQQEAQA